MLICGDNFAWIKMMNSFTSLISSVFYDKSVMHLIALLCRNNRDGLFYD